jgi:hypothetical protein
MIECYFEGQDALKRLRTPMIGSYVDSFALSLHEKGYAYWTVRGCLRSVSHLGCWLDNAKVPLARLDEDLALRFKGHLRRQGGCTPDPGHAALLTTLRCFAA